MQIRSVLLQEVEEHGKVCSQFQSQHLRLLEEVTSHSQKRLNNRESMASPGPVKEWKTQSKLEPPNPGKRAECRGLQLIMADLERCF